MTAKNDPEATLTSQQRRAEVVRLRRARVSFEDIGLQLGITRQRAHQIYWAAMKAIPAQEVDLLRKEQLELYEDLLDRAYAIANRTHLHVSNGKVVRIGEPTVDDEGEPVIDEDAGEPVLDDGPNLAAITELRKIVDSIAKLTGTQVPVKQLIEGDTTVTYVIEGPGIENLT